MTEGMWSDILGRFGQEVILRRSGSEISLRAMVQPLKNQGEQEVHGPLGFEARERFRYLGPAQPSLDLDTAVEWKGKEYRVQSACLTGEGVCPHWRAVLCAKDEAAE